MTSPKHYHFVGIGGIGMGGLALLALAKGNRVSGSDIKDSKMLQELRNKGATVYIGHAGENIKDIDGLVFSTAIDRENPEITAAIKAGVPLLRRAEFLAELMKGHVVVTVAGAHGKTTTSAMASHLLTQAGLRPTCAVGGIVHNFTTNAVMGEGRYFVAEADESDGSFLNYFPDYSLITNIDKEHMDYYGTWEKLLAVHKDYVMRTREGGWLICCGDDPNLRKIVEESSRQHVFYGEGRSNGLIVSDIELQAFGSSFDCFWQGDKISRLTLQVPGKHNVMNAAACVALGLKMGIGIDIVAQSMLTFSGVKRRFQKKGCVNDILVIDDYGHHPTEIKATLAAANSAGRNLTVIFQPHRYTRLYSLYEEFVAVLRNIPRLIVMDIYAASEKPIEGLSAQKFVSDLKKMTLNEVIYLERDKIVPYVISNTTAGDMILTLGAGDVTAVSDELVEALSNQAPGVKK